ncbi:MAG: DUF4838 domain-containing protein [Planctomycetota bacterium]|jgi:hypothetical protein
MRKLIVGIITLCVSLTTLNAAETVDLITDAATAKIIIPDKCKSHTRNAANILQKYIRESTSISLPIYSISQKSKTKDGPFIYVGRSDYVNSLIGGKLNKGTADNFIIKGVGKDIIMAGKTPFATQSAARHFLRKYCGVRWFMAGELWTVVNKQRNLKVSAAEENIEPAFISRWHSGHNNLMNTHGNNLWLQRQGSIPRYRFHHAAASYFPGAKFGKTNPEYYSFSDGRRIIPGKGSLSGWQLCMTNQGVVDRFVEIGKKMYDSGSQYFSVSVSPNDGGIYCECENCIKLYDKNESVDSKTGKTRLVFNMVNNVARKMAKVAPNMKVGIMSYSEYSDPVPGLKIEPNVIMYHVACRSTMKDPVRRKALRDRLVNWKKAGVKKFGLYEWHHGSFFNVPPIYTSVLAEEMKYAVKMGADGWYSEDYPAWGLQGPAHWIVARLLWDINLDADKLLTEYCERLFGRAAKSMKKYFTRCEDTWTSASNGGGAAGTAQYAAYPPEMLTELRGILEKAMQETVRSEPEHTRVKFFANTFGLAERACAAYDAGTKAAAALEKNDIGTALDELGQASTPEKDPVMFMKMVLDQTPQAHYAQSDSLNKDFFTCTRSGLETKIKIAAPAMKIAGDSILKSGKISYGSYENALLENLNSKMPATQTPAMAAAVNSIKEFSGKVVFAPTTRRAPKLDGNLDDKEWQRAPEQTGFYGYGGGAPARYKTTFKMLKHKDRLYASFKCYQNMTRPKASGTVRDSNVWLDDAIEIFLNKSDAKDNSQYFQTIVSINGVIFDMLNKDAKWNGDIKTATKRFKDHWTLEVSIPLKSIGMDPAKVKGLRLNIVRDVFGPGPGNITQISPWFPTFFGHSDLSLRGWLFFPEGE